MTHPSDDDFLPLMEDEEPSNANPETREWKVLVVDDDEDVHQVTVFALSNTLILGRSIRFLHAYTAEQAVTCLKSEADIAVILLDVVMEREDSGLSLVKTIRKELGMHDVRIVLRTGQPGFAPEVQVIRDYDINDYKLKSELSRSSLYATLTTSIRSYEQIHAIAAGHHGLDTIVHATGRMMARHGLHDVADSIIGEIGRLLRHEELSGLICLRSPAPSEQIRVIAATGRYAPLIERDLDTADDAAASQSISQTFADRRHVFADESCALFLCGKSSRELVAYLDIGAPLDRLQQQLVEVFSSNIAISLDNALLFDQLHDHAYNDQLLHIPNRLDFMRTVSNAILSARMDKTVAIVDIDHFSQLNDALGHRYGDILLKAVAGRLVESLPAGTVVARLAADAFGILGDNETLTPDTLQPLFRQPFIVESTEQTVSVTIGLARLSEVDGNGSEAVKAANIALNLAKANGRGECMYFSRYMEFETRARLRLLRDLRSAFEHERLFVVYQPQFDLRSGRISGIEALLRWRTEDGNFVPPNKFIPLAESSGLIVDIGAWVLRAACHDLKRLNDEGFGGLRVAVNVSIAQFRDPDFILAVDDAIRESGIDPAQLELELTESVAMLDAQLMLATLDKLKQRRISIAIDDFGTGFSSLSYLERFNVDRLKIDQSFVNQMTVSNSSLRIVETIIQLSQSLRLVTTAEGVEQPQQAELLKRIGCTDAQGYYFAKPMAFRQLRAMLAAPEAGHGAVQSDVPPPRS